jgi:L-fuculose-phosphate aldolase
MRPEWLIKMNLNGDILCGIKKPSSEVKMHIEVYKQSKDIHSVVHAHPPVSTAFAVARRPLDRPIISEAILTLGVVPVADYATPTTNEVPESIRPFIKEYNSVLLANHGLLSWGKDITQAFFRMESCEQYAKILYYLDRIGTPQEITCENVEILVKIREDSGVITGGTPLCKRSSGIGEVDTEELIRTITKNVIDSLKSR